MKSRIFLLPVIACGLAAAVHAQQPSDKALTPAPMSGKEMFQVYCAVCHGPDARGSGPAAVVLKTPPPDLTLLSRKSGGGFPLVRVQQTILGDVDIPAHGTREMPIYGELFRNIRHDEAFVNLRLGVLVNYLASVQQK